MSVGTYIIVCLGQDWPWFTSWRWDLGTTVSQRDILKQANIFLYKAGLEKAYVSVFYFIWLTLTPCFKFYSMCAADFTHGTNVWKFLRNCLTDHLKSLKTQQVTLVLPGLLQQAALDSLLWCPKLSAIATWSCVQSLSFAGVLNTPAILLIYFVEKATHLLANLNPSLGLFSVRRKSQPCYGHHSGSTSCT